MSDPYQTEREALDRVARETVHVHGSCNTTDGRRVVTIQHVTPVLWEDQPAMRGYMEHMLTEYAKLGPEPATLDLSSFAMKRMEITEGLI